MKNTKTTKLLFKDERRQHNNTSWKDVMCESMKLLYVLTAAWELCIAMGGGKSDTVATKNRDCGTYPALRGEERVLCIPLCLISNFELK